MPFQSSDQQPVNPFAGVQNVEELLAQCLIAAAETGRTPLGNLNKEVILVIHHFAFERWQELFLETWNEAVESLQANPEGATTFEWGPPSE